ncbi:Rhodanese-like protein [Setomelanomma holmii]|uniref:Rhodanese-like protein n=1 Tax=Setomelanomma holmii TaxID=210430 RepID=A0A9P4H3I3_9PLEO|nr:Rhodanese-like protein [Setomelanomma holmii]
MSNIILSSLEFVTREQLATQIKSSQPSPAQGLPPHIAVVDVRDSDHIGGHIKGSTWVPSSTLDHKTPELIRTLKDKEVVVFHCALSQQRGPSAALRYLREKERLDPTSWTESKGEVKEDESEKEEGKGKKKQKVVVLKGGFTEWQEKYGSDEGLTEGWQKDIWEMGY